MKKRGRKAGEKKDRERIRDKRYRHEKSNWKLRDSEKDMKEVTGGWERERENRKVMQIERVIEIKRKIERERKLKNPSSSERERNKILRGRSIRERERGEKVRWMRKRGRGVKMGKEEIIRMTKKES